MITESILLSHSLQTSTSVNSPQPHYGNFSSFNTQTDLRSQNSSLNSSQQRPDGQCYPQRIQSSMNMTQFAHVPLKQKCSLNKSDKSVIVVPGNKSQVIFSQSRYVYDRATGQRIVIQGQQPQQLQYAKFPCSAQQYQQGQAIIDLACIQQSQTPKIIEIRQQYIDPIQMQDRSRIIYQVYTPQHKPTQDNRSSHKKSSSNKKHLNFTNAASVHVEQNNQKQQEEEQVYEYPILRMPDFSDNFQRIDGVKMTESLTL